MSKRVSNCIQYIAVSALIRNVDQLSFLSIPVTVTAVETPVMQDKPKPYRSPLWAHLDEIHEWRLAQDTWEAIADKLSFQYGLKISLQAVHAFFKRANNRHRQRPLGFVAKRSGSIAIQTTVTLAQGSDSIYEFTSLR